MKIITCTQFKGGVAKSTSAAHIAYSLADRGHSVVLLDSDPNQTVFNLSHRAQLPFRVVTEPPFKAGDDFLVMDTQARPTGSEIDEVVHNSDLILMPAIPDLHSVRPLLQAVGRIAHPSIWTCIVMSTHPRSTANTALKEALGKAGINVLGTVVRRSNTFAKAANENKLVYQLSGPYAQKAAQDYTDLTDEILEKISHGKA